VALGVDPGLPPPFDEQSRHDRGSYRLSRDRLALPASTQLLYRTQVEDTIEKATDRLDKRSIDFEVWDAESISERLRDHEDVGATKTSATFHS
jgi:hypothetical protein